MKTKTLILLILICLSAYSQNLAQKKSSLSKLKMIDRVDHIVIMPKEAKGFYNFLVNDLKLPVAWEYRNFGGFSCGAVTVGNVNIESYSNPDEKIESESVITGIAFQPSLPTEELVQKFISVDIDYVVSPSFIEEGRKFWTNTIIKNILPGSQIFSCEYHFSREMLIQKVIDQKAMLNNVNGGVLGIKCLDKINIEVTDMQYFIKKWETLLSPLKIDDNNTFYFPDGTKIKLIKGDSNQINSLKFKVISLDYVKEYLTEANMLGTANKNLIVTNPNKTFGVKMEFCE